MSLPRVSRRALLARSGWAVLGGLALPAALAACAQQSAAPAASTTTGAPAPGGPPTRTARKLTANWTAVSGGMSGIWSAQEAGLFREEGLDLELVHIASTSRAIQSMVAGELAFSPLDPAAVVEANLNGADVALIGAVTNRLVFSVLTRPEIQRPEQLRGKTIGITRIGSSTHTAALVALDMWGLKPDEDVSLRQLQEVPAILSGLQAGQIDGGVVSPPTNTRARQAGFLELLNLAEQGPQYPSICLGGARGWLAANQDAALGYLRAYVRGVQRFKSDHDFALGVLRKYLEIDDPAILEDTHAQFSRYIENVPYVSGEGMAHLIADLAADEPRLAGYTPDQYVDHSLVRVLEANGFFQQVWAA
ncbi:MAG TPA: ABC transporter substrate-binding protein [Chloroflexota bacterium]|nr:ABC transporter substrate-binding protein [Chloroflexota bacterium]